MFKKNRPKKDEEENPLSGWADQMTAIQQQQHYQKMMEAAQQNMWQGACSNQTVPLIANLTGGTNWGNWTASTSSTTTYTVNPAYYTAPQYVKYDEAVPDPVKQKKIEEDPDIYAALDLFSKEKRRQEEAKVA